ncbi:GMC oxidoreductase family protein [Mycobacterium xenopi 4042]|uniref:GMC oxidoreductase family protein n=1 Tax=Mycobacterium xenopi 4042 TaxID=1299334 RepID=X8CG57_MYCXE|nr:GMC oxidoreductase family protein [Mycobacterium xenopi 4042]
MEIRANCMAGRIELDKHGKACGVTYFGAHGGQERFQRAKVIAVAGYSIETPRLLLNSTSGRFPHGLCNNNDQVGRYVMVQGATQSAGRWPDEMRMYKAPPPEVSSEQFYETDPDRGFARGFSIQTVSPLPIAWAEHVLAAGHWGRRCASTCVTTTTGPPSGCSTSCCRCPTTGSRWPTRPINTACRSRNSTTRYATTTRRTWRTPPR